MIGTVLRPYRILPKTSVGFLPSECSRCTLVHALQDTHPWNEKSRFMWMQRAHRLRLHFCICPFFFSPLSLNFQPWGLLNKRKKPMLLLLFSHEVMSKILSPSSEDRLRKSGAEEYLREKYIFRVKYYKNSQIHTSWLKHIVTPQKGGGGGDQIIARFAT